MPRAILEAADCRVLGIDRDPDAIARGQALVERFAGRLTLGLGEFSHMDVLAGPSDGIVLDLGVSSFQFDTPARGFSFRADGPLDMRMSMAGESAADFVNNADHSTLASVIARLGEEKNARRIASAIIAARPVTTTAQLAEIVSKAQGPAALRHAIHPATRTFQALRIHVNDELGELERGLEAALCLLKPAGRLAVVSFHSLEDRIVKQFFTAQQRHQPARLAPSAAKGAQPRRAASHHIPSANAQPGGDCGQSQSPLRQIARRGKAGGIGGHHGSRAQFLLRRASWVWPSWRSTMSPKPPAWRGSNSTAPRRQIADTNGQISVLQTEWERVAGPARIQELAQQQLGMSDTTSVQLSSFDQLPRRGEAAPLGNTPLHNASAVVPSGAAADPARQPADPAIRECEAMGEIQRRIVIGAGLCIAAFALVESAPGRCDADARPRRRPVLPTMPSSPAPTSPTAMANFSPAICRSRISMPVRMSSGTRRRRRMIWPPPPAPTKSAWMPASPTPSILMCWWRGN